MLSKIICAAAVVSSGINAHSINTRDTNPAYKVNRDSEYGAPAAPAYSAPSPSYSAPAPSYSAPAPSYSAPAAAPSYSAPDTSYGAPSTGYGAPSYEAEEVPTGGGLDLTSILIPILALIGLSLLFPTFVSVSAGRRKRSAGEEANPMYDLAERVNDIYGAVLESEECMEKIACELGAMTNTITGGVPSIVEPFVPAKYSRFYKQFKNGSSCDKIKCGKAF